MNDQIGGAKPWELLATFANSEQMQEAVISCPCPFQSCRLSLPSPGLIDGTETPEEGTKPASTEADARQARTLGASTRRQRRLPLRRRHHGRDRRGGDTRVAAAVAAGGAAGGAVFAGHGLGRPHRAGESRQRAAHGDLVLAVRATTEAKRTKAETILRNAGATGHRGRYVGVNPLAA